MTLVIFSNYREYRTGTPKRLTFLPENEAVPIHRNTQIIQIRERVSRCSERSTQATRKWAEFDSFTAN
jgi:hypothetical protein